MSEHNLPKKHKVIAKENDKVLMSKEQDEKIEAALVPKRRVRMLMVNPADFMFLFTKGLRLRKNYKLVKGVPEDAKLISIAPDSIRNGIMLVVESSEYNEIPINVLPPVEPVDIDVTVHDATKVKKVARKK